MPTRREAVSSGCGGSPLDSEWETDNFQIHFLRQFSDELKPARGWNGFTSWSARLTRVF